eukprot:TRINITY_DN5981_c0_g1_i1.p1 TRINITY_DN5981_c0_g1~~TRINITY_DN5981_c0_g1_i1.p1  ORF type:complete len:416 (-),score=34.52 TRINITY_DN5981_c0_g1_i1:14-1261(-)
MVWRVEVLLVMFVIIVGMALPSSGGSFGGYSSHKPSLHSMRDPRAVLIVSDSISGYFIHYMNELLELDWKIATTMWGYMFKVFTLPYVSDALQSALEKFVQLIQLDWKIYCKIWSTIFDAISFVKEAFLSLKIIDAILTVYSSVFEPFLQRVWNLILVISKFIHRIFLIVSNFCQDVSSTATYQNVSQLTITILQFTHSTINHVFEFIGFVISEVCYFIGHTTHTTLTFIYSTIYSIASSIHSDISTLVTRIFFPRYPGVTASGFRLAVYPSQYMYEKTAKSEHLYAFQIYQDSFYIQIINTNNIHGNYLVFVNNAQVGEIRFTEDSAYSLNAPLNQGLGSEKFSFDRLSVQGKVEVRVRVVPEKQGEKNDRFVRGGVEYSQRANEEETAAAYIELDYTKAFDISATIEKVERDL